MNNLKYNRIKQRYRLYLGINQLVTYPVWNLIWFIPLFAAILLDYIRTIYITQFSVAEMLQPIFNGCLLFVTIFFPILLSVLILQGVGEVTARNIEEKLKLCFDKKDLEKGTPILISKKRNLNRFYVQLHSFVPMETWQEKKNAIQDMLDMRIVKISYGKRGNIIKITASKGRIPKNKGAIYDENL